MAIGRQRMEGNLRPALDRSATAGQGSEPPSQRQPLHRCVDAASARVLKSIENVHSIGAWLTRKYGFHMSEQTNSMLSDNGLPMRVKNCSKLSTVRSVPIHSSRVQPC